jgi:hypothetical protein
MGAVGQVLTVDPGTWTSGTGTVALTYQWQSSTDGSTWKNISEASESALTLGKSEAGDQVRAVVTGRESGYTTASVPSNVISVTS